MIINRRQDRSCARTGPTDLRAVHRVRSRPARFYSKAAAIVGGLLVSDEWPIAAGERLIVVVCVRPTGSGEDLLESLLL